MYSKGSAAVQPKKLPTTGIDDVQVSSSNDGPPSVVASPPAVAPRPKPRTVCSIHM